MALNYASIGSRIKAIRTQRNMSQEELAELIQVDPRHVSRIETAASRPSLNALVDIVNALQISLDDLLHEELLYPKSVIGSEIHSLLLDCNQDEYEMLTRTIQFLKALFQEYNV